MELIELAKQISEAEKRGESTGLTQDELAFYDALANNNKPQSFIKLFDDSKQKKIVELVSRIKENAVKISER